ncbi:MAG: A24 family peptidase [Eubacterium sp.]|nr:A24 family peptidase [Eubacterium sp.]
MDKTIEKLTIPEMGGIGVVMGIEFICMMIYGTGMVHVFSLLVLSAFLIYIAKIDLKHYIIPNKLVLLLLAFRVISISGEVTVGLFTGSENMEGILSTVLNYIFGSVMVILLFSVVKIIFKNSIGWGDVKLFTVIGLYVGTSGIMSVLLISSILALVYGMANVIRKNYSMKDRMSFGPFIAAGTILSIIICGC